MGFAAGYNNWCVERGRNPASYLSLQGCIAIVLGPTHPGWLAVSLCTSIQLTDQLSKAVSLPSPQTYLQVLSLTFRRYSNALTLCAEISAASVVIGFWNDTINVAAWITIIIVVVLALNIFAVSIYGEAEFIFASIKLITIIGLLILAFIIDLGGGPKQGRLGFRYWVSGDETHHP